MPSVFGRHFHPIPLWFIGVGLGNRKERSNEESRSKGREDEFGDQRSHLGSPHRCLSDDIPLLRASFMQ
jgi:hypothetical protein